MFFVPRPSIRRQSITMADMAAKVVKDEQTVKKVAVVGGGLVRISVKVPGFLEEITFIYS